MSGRWVPRDGLPVAGSSADRLLDSAERLVALEGLHGASSRAITLAAGHRNSNAIAYHFGDREGLFAAVWYRRASGIDHHRTREVLALERDGRTEDPEALVAALVHPVAAELLRRSPSYWARFQEAVLSSYPLDSLVRHGTGPVADPASTARGLGRTLAHLRALSAQGCEPLASRRVVQVVRTGVTSLACWERDVEAGRLERGALDALSADLVRTGAAVLTAPTGGGPGAAPGALAPARPGATREDTDDLIDSGWAATDREPRV